MAQQRIIFFVFSASALLMYSELKTNSFFYTLQRVTFLIPANMQYFLPVDIEIWPSWELAQLLSTFRNEKSKWFESKSRC